MKKLFLCLCLIGICVSLKAQGVLPYQKGEHMIGLSDPYFSSIKSPSTGSNVGYDYRLELDYSRFIANNWSIGAGGSLFQSQVNQNEYEFGFRTLGIYSFTRYYLPAIKIKSTYLNFYGEAWGGTDRTFSNNLINNVAFQRTNLYGGLGAAYRPFRFFSVDFCVQRGWQKMVDQSTSLVISEGEDWNVSAGFNFHLQPKTK